MSYLPSDLIFYSVTGLAAVAGEAPRDMATFSMPISGARYMKWTELFWTAVGTGGIGGSYNVYTAPGGGGYKLNNSDYSLAGNIPDPLNFVFNQTTSSVQSGTFTTPTVTLRQTVASTNTGIVGIKIGFLRLI